MQKEKSGRKSLIFSILAEAEGFEPPEPFSSTVFKTAAIDHSANSPKVWGANVRRILRKTNNLHLNLILILGCHDFFGTDRGENGNGTMPFCGTLPKEGF